MSTSPAILRNFDAAARRYDLTAGAQAKIAARLVAWAAASIDSPASILDVGSGTGFVAAELHRRWPLAAITALDASPAMLKEAKRKVPQLSVLIGDMLTAEPRQKFAAIFSSMALHWLPEPRAALLRWQGWLQPGGKLFVAVPVENSFREWRALCQRHDVAEGLWVLPQADFAEGFADKTMRESITVTYPSAREFLRSMKLTGAATPRPGHRPVATARMRRLLRNAPQPFSTVYDVAFVERSARPQGSLSDP